MFMLLSLTIFDTFCVSVPYRRPNGETYGSEILPTFAFAVGPEAGLGYRAKPGTPSSV